MMENVKNVKALESFVEENFSSFALPLLNGYIQFIYKNKCGCVDILRKFDNELSLTFKVRPTTVRNGIRRSINNYKNLKRSLNRDWERMVQFLNSPFQHQPIYAVEDAQLENDKEIMPSENVANSLQINESMSTENIASSSYENIQSTSLIGLKNVFSSPSKRCCEKCLIRKNSLKESANIVKNLKSQIRDLKSLKKKNLKNLKWKNRCLKQLATRRQSSTMLWKTKYQQAKAAHRSKTEFEKKLFNTIKILHISNSQLKRHSRNARSQYALHIKEKDENIKELTKDLKISKNRLDELIYENHRLISIILEEQPKDVTTEVDKVYA